MELDPGPRLAAAHYDRGEEALRLSSGPGRLEQERTRELLLRYLPAPPARVADIGAGPGAYSLWLAECGYDVTARDLVSHHVAQLLAGAEQRGVTVDAEVADARDLDLADHTFDAVLLFGPLYHLRERVGRVQALREACRIVRPGGVVLVVAISRWAVVLDGMLRLRLTETDPGFASIVDTAIETGWLNPLLPNGFSGYLHRPAELRAEAADAGLRERMLLSVEGPGAYLVDIDERWPMPSSRELVLDVARRLEAVPELAGMGSHLMLVAERHAG
jgi:SAM-dependent methyltransferase